MIDIAAIAALAQLDLEPEETAVLQRDLTAILGYVERLAQIPTEGVEPMSQPPASGAPLREDQARVWFSRSQALANAPASADGMFEVPKIIDR